LQATRHARRIYAGGVPPTVTEYEIEAFFNSVVSRALAPAGVEGGGNPVIKVYLNSDKCYAFVEFGSVELATACMQLDNIKYDHHTGVTTLRIRRPNDYRPELLPPSNAPIPVLNLAAVGLTASTVPTNPASAVASKIFVGGLPYNLTDDQVMELLGAFGPIRAFNQVRDPGATNTKGYAFCEYVSESASKEAVAGLNGMKIGDKTLTVRPAVPSSAMPGPGNNSLNNQMQQQQLLSSNPLMSAMGFGGQPQMNYGAGAPFGALGNVGAGGGYGGGQYQQQSAAFPAPSQLASMLPTRVLKLCNMVTHEELVDNNEFREIKEDVRLECADYGQVLQVTMPREMDGYTRDLEGFIFVEFADAHNARAAALALNGRKFGDKLVVVQFVSSSIIGLIIFSPSYISLALPFFLHSLTK
jgi:splicing factor U2AF subunit